MTSIFGHHPADRPPRTEEWSTGVTISIAAHLALIGALWWGLHWRSSSVEVASSAELWSAVPEAEAPPPVETPPPPPQPVVETPPPPPVETPKPPDIVTEQIKEKKPPPKPVPPPPPPPKPAPPKPAPAPPPPPKLDAKALQKLHDENLKRMMGQMDAPATATGTAARNKGPSANWAGLIAAAINKNLYYAGSMAGLRPPDLRLKLAPDGTILNQQITSSSGNALYDDAVLKAVIATAKLPRDTDGTYPEHDISLTFNP
jgi:colicin import membrane protein